MRDLDSQFPARIINDDWPIALRRKRRINVESVINSRPIPSLSRSQPKVSQAASGISTPPETPKRAKKRVRFSDPGAEIQCEPLPPPSSSSGLTPFIQRSSLTTPTSNRRHSTPSPLWNRAARNAPISGTLQFAPLRQVLDGRVKRRLKRNRLSQEINIIECDKRHEAKARKSEVERLRRELAAKDREVQALMDEQEAVTRVGGAVCVNADMPQSKKIQDLELVISDLRSELQRKGTGQIESPNWTMAARDPFNFDDDDGGDNMITNNEYNFEDGDEIVTTPTRLNTSFQTPPSTVPNTPCSAIPYMGAGAQENLPIPDSEKDLLKSQLESLKAEVSKLASVIALKEDNDSRLAGKLSEYLPDGESHVNAALDCALDSVLTELTLSQSSAQENLIALSALGSEITNLGFPTAGPEETLEAIAKQFRKARLELEYLTPGEIVEGFENHKLLEMLVSRIRVLVTRSKEQDSTIDEYHEQDVLLRQQLNTRVSVTDDLHHELSQANRIIDELKAEAEEQDTSIQRLQHALDGYRTEVAGLEKLIEDVEAEGRRHNDQLRCEARELHGRLDSETLKHDTTRASDQGKNMIITELELRLAAALQATSNVQAQLAAYASSGKAALAERDEIIEQLKSTLLQREKAHGGSLALRDARVCELRDEVDRVNDALKAAYTTIVEMRKDAQALKAHAESDRKRWALAVKAVSSQLTRALEQGTCYTAGDISTSGSIRGRRAGSAPVEGERNAVVQDHGQYVVRRAGLFNEDLERRQSGKKRRKYDSGLGFLEEEEEEVHEEM